MILFEMPNLFSKGFKDLKSLSWWEIAVDLKLVLDLKEFKSTNDKS